MLLGLDLGTTNIKALFVHEDGTVLGQGSSLVELHHVADNGIEQNIESIWQATLQAINQVGQNTDLSSTRAIGISSQGGAIQCRTRDGQYLTPVISWMDGRGQPFDNKLTEKMGPTWFGERIGHTSSGIAIGQLLRLREQNPDLLQQPNLIGFVGDAIVQKLCDRPAHDHSSLSICNLYNPSLGKADPDVLDLLNIQENQLPDLLPARTPAGKLTRESAQATGLPAGIPVSPAVHDQYAAALGCGAIATGDIMFGAGTAWVLLATSNQPMQPVAPLAWVCDHLVPNQWGQLLSLIVGGSVFSWALKLAGLSSAEGHQIDNLLASVAPGSDGLILLPFHDGMGGPRRPTAGGLVGLQLAHGQAHLLRATVEGLCFELNRQLDWLTDAGCPTEKLIMCGRAATTKTTPQIVADITNRPVCCPEQSEVSGFGAAILARALIEPQETLETLADTMAGPTTEYRPGPAASSYADRFQTYKNAVDHYEPMG